MKPAASRRRFGHAVKSKQPKVNRRRPQPIFCTGAGKHMTAEQAARLNQLAPVIHAPESGCQRTGSGIAVGNPLPASDPASQRPIVSLSVPAWRLPFRLQGRYAPCGGAGFSALFGPY
jgi:hypothetical protein